MRQMTQTAGLTGRRPVVLAVTLSGTSRIHASFHRPPPPAQAALRFTPPLVPNGYVRVPDTHQLIPPAETGARESGGPAPGPAPRHAWLQIRGPLPITAST